LQVRVLPGAPQPPSSTPTFFAATAGGFDAGEQGWSFEQVDFAYFRAPYLAGRGDADACVRLVLQDFAHYATLRKPRGEDATLLFDGFSAIAGGREAAIQLTERARDAGCALYLSAQSADGLGDEQQQAREGEAWLVARGRYEHLVVAPPASATATAPGRTRS
jgi:hypothetical protein